MGIVVIKYHWEYAEVGIDRDTGDVSKRKYQQCFGTNRKSALNFISQRIDHMKRIGFEIKELKDVHELNGGIAFYCEKPDQPERDTIIFIESNPVRINRWEADIGKYL